MKSLWIVPALLGAATAVSRLPFLAPRLAHWDAVNYALGLHDFDVAAHQPHPPGSPYFILLGRAALLFTGDDNAALLTISVLASAGAVIAEYALARLMFGPRAGWLAAIILLTQPVFWGYGTIANAWTVLALVSLLIGLCCVALLRGNTSAAVPSGLLIGTVSGFRFDAALFLAPLWLWSLWRAEPRTGHRLLAIALAPVSALVWLVPAVASGGGLDAWLRRTLALLPSTDRPVADLLHQLATNTEIAFGTLLFAVLPGLLLGLACDWRQASRWLRATLTCKSGTFWALWIAPAFLFLWLVDATEPGHDLIFLVAVCALTGGLLAASARQWSRVAVAGAVLAALQASIFAWLPPQSDQPLASALNSMLLNVTAVGLREQQASLQEALQTIRARFDPRDTAIVTVVGQDAYRYMMYYLPEYRVLRLDPGSHTVLPAFDRHQGNWTEVSGCLFDPYSIREAVWVLTPRSGPGDAPVGATPIAATANAPFEVWPVAVDGDTPDYFGFRFERDCA